VAQDTATVEFPSLSERSTFLTFLKDDDVNQVLEVSISFREKYLPDYMATVSLEKVYFGLFPSLSERSTFLTN